MRRAWLSRGGLAAFGVLLFFWVRYDIQRISRNITVVVEHIQGLPDPNQERHKPSNINDTTGSLFPANLNGAGSKDSPGKEIDQDQDKVIVVGKLQDEDTSWIARDLPDWQNAVYVVDDISAPLHTRTNKGREALPYLTFIIDNYQNLPAIMAFIHSHRGGYPTAWHTDAEGYSNVQSIRELRLDTVQKKGYVNLRCIWTPGCPVNIRPFRFHDPDEEGIEENTEIHIANAYQQLFNVTLIEVPNDIGSTCCAQFAVSKDQVLKRPLNHYVWFRSWLLETRLSDYISGRVFEYMWHIIFGKDAVDCPAVESCWCDVYGRGCSVSQRP